MKLLNQWLQVMLLVSSLLVLTACSTTKKTTDAAAVNNANAAYQSDSSAQSSGLGEEEGGFTGDDDTHQTASSNKRTYYFDFDSTVVRDEDKGAIAANAHYLLAHPHLKAMLEGYTDPRGSREYNIGLGERRAKAVAEILSRTGVNPAQIRVVSYGAEKLASLGHMEADYQQDRRVVLVHLQR